MRRMRVVAVPVPNSPKPAAGYAFERTGLILTNPSTVKAAWLRSYGLAVNFAIVEGFGVECDMISDSCKRSSWIGVMPCRRFDPLIPDNDVPIMRLAFPFAD